MVDAWFRGKECGNRRYAGVALRSSFKLWAATRGGAAWNKVRGIAGDVTFERLGMAGIVAGVEMLEPIPCLTASRRDDIPDEVGCELNNRIDFVSLVINRFCDSEGCEEMCDGQKHCIHCQISSRTDSIVMVYDSYEFIVQK
ncbi:hypothetical protein PM082_016473 [Marasmius tenuissimus]|nr:hypothetical protein PM082_016473 [Marasmius tenuissimus]